AATTSSACAVAAGLVTRTRSRTGSGVPGTCDWSPMSSMRTEAPARLTCGTSQNAASVAAQATTSDDRRARTRINTRRKRGSRPSVRRGAQPGSGSRPRAEGRRGAVALAVAQALGVAGALPGQRPPQLLEAADRLISDADDHVAVLVRATDSPVNSAPRQIFVSCK